MFSIKLIDKKLVNKYKIDKEYRIRLVNLRYSIETN